MYEYQEKQSKKNDSIKLAKVNLSRSQDLIQRFIGFEFQFLNSKVSAERDVQLPCRINDNVEIDIDGGIDGESGNLEMITIGSIDSRENVGQIVGGMAKLGSRFYSIGKGAKQSNQKQFDINEDIRFNIERLKDNLAQPQINTDMAVDRLIDTYPDVITEAIRQGLFSGKDFNWERQQSETVINESVDIVRRLATEIDRNISEQLIPELKSKVPNIDEQKVIENLPLFKGWVTCVITQLYQDFKIPRNGPANLRYLIKDVPILLKTSPDEILRAFAARLEIDYRTSGFKDICFQTVYRFIQNYFMGIRPEQLQEFFQYTEDDIYYGDDGYRTPSVDGIDEWEDDGKRHQRDKYVYHHYDLAHYDGEKDKHIPLSNSTHDGIMKIVMELRRCPSIPPKEWVGFALRAFDLFRQAQ